MHVLITGANRGLGKRIATKLSPLVKQLYVASRDPDQMEEDYKANNIAFHKALPLDLSVNHFSELWEPFKGLNKFDAIIHAASPYIPKKLTETSDDEADFIGRCVKNEMLFLKNVSQYLNPNKARLIVTSAIIAEPGSRSRGIMSWSKSSLDALAEILHYELPSGVKVLNFILGTFRDDETLIESGDAISIDFVAEKIKDAALGIYNIDTYQVCLKAPNDAKLLEELKNA